MLSGRQRSPVYKDVSVLHVTAAVTVVQVSTLILQDDGPSELEEVENELNSSPRRQPVGARRLVSNVVIEAFTMTFLAEWGDRSQITTISLAAVQDAFGVTVGGCIGHFLCTGAAVLGGKQLASVIDERTVNIVGAVMFLIFGALAIYEGPGE